VTERIGHGLGESLRIVGEADCARIAPTSLCHARDATATVVRQVDRVEIGKLRREDPSQGVVVVDERPAGVVVVNVLVDAA